MRFSLGMTVGISPGGFDPTEERLRANAGRTIEAVLEEELADFLARRRHRRGDGPAKASVPSSVSPHRA